MRVFITGALGFIGTHAVRRLAQQGHELVCLVRETSDATWLRGMGATIATGDVMDRESVRAAMRGCEWALHLANLYSFWQPDKRLYAAVNVGGTRNVMECALETGIYKVLHISTAAVYGNPADCPFTEASPVGPARFSEYARTKYEGDLIAWELHGKKGLPLVVLYPGSVLGPGDTKPTAQYITNLLHRKIPVTAFPDSAITYVHVRDVAEAIVRALAKEDNVGEKYLIGKHSVPYRLLNEMIRDISGVPLPRLCLPAPLAMATGACITALADLTKRPPIWGATLDALRTMRAGFQFDGSKAERELGLVYTPIRVAVEEAIASFLLQPTTPAVPPCPVG